MQKYIDEFLDSKNLLILHLNLLFISIILVLFFWFVISNLFLNLIISKSSLINSSINKTDVINNGDIINNGYYNFTNITELHDNAMKDYNDRYYYNVQLLFHDIGPFFYYLIAIIIIIFIYIYTKKIKLTRKDFMLLIMVFFSFSCELLLFFEVVNKWQFIGDEFIIKTLLID